MKKGQITWFLIVILVLVFFIFLALSFWEDGLRSPLRPSDKLVPEQYITDCETDAAECMLFRLGMTSGKIVFDTGVLPSFDQMQTNAQKYVKNNPHICFAGLNTPGKKLIVNGLQPNVRFNRKDVRVEIKNEMILKGNDSEEMMRDYTHTFPIRYKDLYDTAIEIRKPLRFSRVPSKAFLLNDLAFDMNVVNRNGTRVVSLIQEDPQPNIKNEYYRFMFLK